MKRTLVIILVILFSLQAETSKLELSFFGSATCGECFEMKSELLIPLSQKHKDSLVVTYYNLDR